MLSTLRKPGHLSMLAVIAVLATACAGGGGKTTAPGGGASVQDLNNANAAKVQKGGELTYAADQPPAGFNTNTSNGNLFATGQIVQNVFPSSWLYWPDLSAHLNDAMLVSATQTNASPQTIVYKIRPEAVWSDGQQISADDFIYFWTSQSGKNKKYDVSSTLGYDQIANVVGSDNGKTVTVTFAKPFPEWQSLFNGLLPAHYMKTLSPDPVEAWNNGLTNRVPQISGGAYQITSYKKNQSLILTPNLKWYGKEGPFLNRIIFRFIEDSSQQPAALKNNEVQLIYPQPQLDLVQQVKNTPGVSSSIGAGPIFEHLDFNLKNSILADKNVRQAIATAINRQQIIAGTVGQFSSNTKPLDNRIFMPSQKGYQDNFASAGYGNGDMAKANQLMEQAGYTKDAQGLWAKNGKSVTLRITTTAGNKLRENQEQIFQTQMKQFGINIKIDNSPADVYFGERLPKGDYDIADFAWVGSPFPISGSVDIYRTTGGSNYGKYSNPQVDQWLNQASSELDLGKAYDLMNQVDKQVSADAYTIPLYQKPTFIAYYDKYGNVRDNPTNHGPFYNAFAWGLKTTAK